MNIVYTYHGLNSKIGGVTRYFSEIIAKLSENNNIYFAARYSKCLYFSETIKSAPKFLKFNFRGKLTVERFLQNSYLKTFPLKNVFLSPLAFTLQPWQLSVESAEYSFLIILSALFIFMKS